MLALPFALCVLPFAPCTLPFAPCACGVSLLSNGASIPLALVVVVTSCNLHWWCFFVQPLVQTLHLHSGTCIIYYLILLRKGGSLMPEPAEKPSLYYIIILYHHLKCTMRRTGVPIRWTGALDWTIYWTRVILCKSVNDVITNRPPSCVVRVASIGSLCEWMFLLFPDPLTPNIYTSCLALTLHHLLTTSSFECCFT